MNRIMAASLVLNGMLAGFIAGYLFACDCPCNLLR